MVDVQTEIIIQRPKSKVSAYAVNPENAPSWYINIESAEWQGSQNLAPGSQIAFTAHFLGRELSYVYEIVELIPGQKLVMQTADGPFPMETTYLWEEIDANTTCMSLRNRGNPDGFSKLFMPFIRLAMKRANKKDLKKLKEILET